MVDVPPQWRGSTTALAGLRPFPTAAAPPSLGVPMGPALVDQPGRGPVVCADPITWFERGNLIGNPSAFVLGRPGLGKSTAVRRWVLGLAASGVTPLILGDLKPDYTALVTALGGQVIRLGRGAGVLNVLDPGGMEQAADRLPPLLAEQMRAEAHNRRVTMVTGLLALARASALTEPERLGLTAALRDLAAPGRPTPVLGDLMTLLHQPTPADAGRHPGARRRHVRRPAAVPAALDASPARLPAGGHVQRAHHHPPGPDQPRPGRGRVRCS